MGKSRDLAKLGGTVNSSGEVPTAGIANSAVTTDKIAANAVVTADIADGAVTTAKIAAGAVATVDIADSAVTTAKIADANVTVAKISASGTPSSTTFLRGDGSWQAVSSTPTTSQVLTAYAGASAGAVGTYAYLIPASGSVLNAGNTIAGSSCRYGGVNSYYWSYNGVFYNSGGAPSGTWMCVGRTLVTNDCGYYTATPTVFLRIA